MRQAITINFFVKVDFFYTVRAGTEQARRDCKIINNAFILETVSSDKKKEAVGRTLRFRLIMKI